MPTEPTAKRGTFLTFGQPDIREPEIDEVVDTLRSGWIGTGPKTKRFEEAFAAYVGAGHAVALNSCTAGLHLALLALGIGPGDEVITSTLTFAATANVIVHVGATPILVDVDDETQNIDVDQVVAHFSERTKAIIPVHMAGRPCDMPALTRIAQDRGIDIIEDAAHAVEASIDGLKIGSISRVAAFSFYATKNVVTGEGGMVTTNDAELADRIRIASLHGMSRDAWKRYSSSGFQHYDIETPGWKYNMTDIQASLGLHQLARVDENLRHREQIWSHYDSGLSGIPGIRIPSPYTRGTHARHLYAIRIDKEQAGVSRDEMIVALKERNIGTGVHFTPVHQHSYYRTRSGGTISLPIAERIGAETLSIPLSSRLTIADADDVISAIRDVLDQAQR